jgi:hypothetical protein
MHPCILPIDNYVRMMILAVPSIRAALPQEFRRGIGLREDSLSVYMSVRADIDTISFADSI